MDPPHTCKKQIANDEYAKKNEENVIRIGDTELGRQEGVTRMHIYGAMDNMNNSERENLRKKLELMDSEHVVVDTGDIVQVACTKTTNTSAAMDYVGGAIVTMQLEIINISFLNILLII